MSQIENILHEHRLFPPSREFQSKARLSSEAAYQRMYRESIEQPESFWGRIARELPWIEPFKQVLDWSGAPFAQWFVGGKLNVSAVCLDQHAYGRRARQRPAPWGGGPGGPRTPPPPPPPPGGVPL